MGGFGSGREAQYKTVEQARLDAWSIGEVVRRHRWGLPESAPSVDVFCKSALGPHRLVCGIPIIWKPAGYGPRPFFACPHCAKACSILFPTCSRPVGVAPHTEDWGCRKCAELVYASQSRGRHERMKYRYERVAYTLGASLFDFLPLVWESLVETGWMKPEELEKLPTIPPRPRYMRKARYEHLVYQWTLAQAQKQASHQLTNHSFALHRFRREHQDSKRISALTASKVQITEDLEAMIAEWKAAIRTPGNKK
jgi:hypothetical protein